MDIINYCTKVKSAKIRFLTLVEKLVPPVYKPYYLILRRFNLWESFCKSLKNNNGVSMTEISIQFQKLRKSNVKHSSKGLQAS